MPALLVRPMHPDGPAGPRLPVTRAAILFPTSMESPPFGKGGKAGPVFE